MFNKKKHHKKHNISRKRKSELGLDTTTHPPTSEFFSDFWLFIKLDKTPYTRSFLYQYVW